VAQLELRYKGLYNGSLDGVVGPETRRPHNDGLHRTVTLDPQTMFALTDSPALAKDPIRHPIPKAPNQWRLYPERAIFAQARKRGVLGDLECDPNRGVQQHSRRAYARAYRIAMSDADVSLDFALRPSHS
jgi:hypothetical protein